MYARLRPSYQFFAWWGRKRWPSDSHSKVVNGVRPKKNAEKSTYPPPADGLCVPFLCKRVVGCKRCPSSSPLRALGEVSQLHRVQGFAKKCSGLAHTPQGGREVVTQTRCAVYGGYGCENLLQAVFSFSGPFISGVNRPPSNPTQKRLRGPACKGFKRL